MDYKTLTDEDLATCIQNATAERDRRARLISLPRQISILTATYLADGGNLDELTSTDG